MRRLRHLLAASSGGFSLLELMVAMVLTGVGATLAIPCGLRLVQYSRLLFTRDEVLWQLRYAQQAAESAATYGEVRFAPYDPWYWTVVGGVAGSAQTFSPGVSYRDGYLQLTTPNLFYDVYGNCQVAGKIRLVTKHDEADINLYMGVGLQTVGGH